MESKSKRGECQNCKNIIQEHCIKYSGHPEEPPRCPHCNENLYFTPLKEIPVVCIECTFCELTLENIHVCNHPESYTREFDVVTGYSDNLTTCYKMRESLCKGGVLYEPRKI